MHVIVTKLKIKSCAGLNDSRFLNGTLVRNQPYTDQGSARLPEGIRGLFLLEELGLKVYLVNDF